MVARALAVALGLVAGGPALAQMVKVTAPAPENNDRFGSAIALDGSHLLVGMPQDDGACPTDPLCDSGSAFVFEHDGFAWTQKAKLTASDAAAGDLFGHAVAISGERLAIGAYQDDDFCPFAIKCNSGSVYTYLDFPDYGWIPSGKLTAPPPDHDDGDHFGRALDLDGNVLVVGAWADDQPICCNVGSAYIFERAFGEWNFVQKLSPPVPDNSQSFGWSVAIDGTTIVVGAPGEGADSGAAYVYESAGGTWSAVARLTGSDTVAGEEFGLTVDIEGDTALVGIAVDALTANSSEGAVYVFDRTSGWMELDKLTNPVATELIVGWGYRVAMNAATIAASVTAKGRVDLFQRHSPRGLLGGFTPFDASAGIGFGQSLAMTGRFIAIGAPLDDESCPLGISCNTGSVYIRTLPFIFADGFESGSLNSWDSTLP